MQRVEKLPLLSEREFAPLLPFLSEAALWSPNYVDTLSAWTEHVPFAFWLTHALEPACFVELGTHSGVSYLAFCQAIEALALPTRAYAIDTWRGDEHAGYYGEEVFAKLSRMHDTRYASFSSLVRTTFDEAVDQCADGSIDLLHIDGLHTYEAVKHDFESWRSKLAPRSIVLFHDTNVRERGFGVWKLWRELSESYPHFEFLHGHGLGVLGVGAGFPSALAALFAATYEARTAKCARDLFSRLGGYVASKVVVDQMSNEVAGRDIRTAELASEIAAFQGRCGELSEELTARDARITELSNEIVARDARITELVTRATVLDARIDALSSEVSSRDHLIQELRAQAVELNAEIAGLRHQVDAQQAACGEVRAQAAAHAARIGTMKKSLSWRLTRPLRGRVPRKPSKKLKRAWKSITRLHKTEPAKSPDEMRSPVVAFEQPTDALPALPPARLLQPTIPTIGHVLAKRPCVVFLSGEPETPGHYYRIENMRGALARRYYDTIVIRNDELSERAKECARADLLWIWRTCWTDPIARAVELARCNNARVVFDVDDLMFRPDIANAEIIDGIRSQCISEQVVAQGYSLVRHTLAMADHATAPTETLAHELRCAFKPASVIPNGFDRYTLALARNLRLARANAASDGRLRIGYASGSRTHQRDLAQASQGIADVMAAHPHVLLVLFEHTVDVDEFSELASVAGQIEWRPLVPVRELPKEYARFDINIAPLEVGNVFCEAKSELKFFESALCGVVTVASPTRPFREAIRHGETGFLAASPDEWRHCLESLINDPDLRRRTVEAALGDVLCRYGPERRSVLVTRLITRLLAPPPVAGELARNSLLEPRPAAKRIDMPEFDVVYASPRRGVSRVAIVVPLHNYAHHVREALESVAAQTVRELDVIVVDDRSTDESLDVARTWLAANQQEFNHVALLQNKVNEKLSRTRNAGIHYADAEIVLPLDADNQLLPTCVERCMALLDETNAAMAFPTIEMFGDKTGLITEQDWDPARLQFGNYIDAMAMFRKACWLAVGGYAAIEYGWEDYDLWCKFVEAGFWGVRVPEITARYRVHGQSMLQTVTEVPENRERAVADLIRQHPWLDILPPSPSPAPQPQLTPAVEKPQR